MKNRRQKQLDLRLRSRASRFPYAAAVDELRAIERRARRGRRERVAMAYLRAFLGLMQRYDGGAADREGLLAGARFVIAQMQELDAELGERRAA